MIEFDYLGKVKLIGPYTYLGDVYAHFKKDEILEATIKGIFRLDEWNNETIITDKLSDLNNTYKKIRNSDLEKFVEYHEKRRENASMEIILKRMETMEISLRALTTAISELAKSQKQVKETLTKPAFVGLEEIAEKFNFGGKPFYSVNTLRNLIKKEKISPELEIGTLNINEFKLILLKKGKRWVTLYSHLQEESQKLDYDFTRALVKRRSKASGLIEIQKMGVKK